MDDYYLKSNKTESFQKMKDEFILTESKPGFFYGWYIVMGLATVSMVSVGMGGMNLGLFVHPMNEELGINHAYFGLSQTARMIGFSMSSWFIGKILDQHGARVPMAIAAALMGLIMVGLSRLQTGWHLVALIFMSGMIGLEGGGGNLYQSVPLSRWFIKKRGKAMSISFLGTTAGIFLFTPLLQYTITYINWRFAWIAIGCGSCLVIFIIAIAVVRKDPYSMGMKPDGEVGIEEEKNIFDIDDVNMQDEYSWTRSQALRSLSFWSLIIVLGLRMLSMSTLNIFRIPFYMDRGISPMHVAWAVSAEAIISAIIAIPTGWAMDRFQPRYIASTSLIVFILVFIVTINVRTTVDVYIATSLFGISAASFMVAHNALWPAYFGGMHIGSIRGIAVPFTMLFGAIGAPITGYVKDTTGSYINAWKASIVFLTVATVVMLLNPKPSSPIDNEEQSI
jgi:MFS family permease